MAAPFRFGPYELDVAELELRKNGVRLKLQEQPFRVLTALVERPGEVITREELRNRLWGHDTFVDFDQSLNKAINRLREMLRDDASQPRYIETVPRRGYRFVAHVQASNGTTPVPSPVPNVLLTEDRTPPRREVRLGALITVVSVAAAFLLIAIWRMHRPAKPALSPPRLLVRDALFPSVSSDGKLLAYISNVGGDVPQVWVRPVASGKALQLTRGAARHYFSELSPDGTQILVASEEQGTEVQIMSVFSGEAEIPVPHALWCRFSPVGEMLLCAVAEPPQAPDPTISLVMLSHGEQRPVAFVNREYQMTTPPVWSATGTSFLFLGRRRKEPAADFSWWIADLSTSSVRRLALPGLVQGKEMPPVVQSWSRFPDSRMFIFYSVQDQNAWRLYRIRVSNTGEPLEKPEQVIAGTGVFTGAAPVSTNGTLVYAVADLSEELFEIPVDPRGRRTGPVQQLPLPDGALYYSPSVSRDGRRMVYIQAEFGQRKFVTLRDFPTGTERLLDKSTGVPRDGSASLSSNGSRVVFNRWCDLKQKPDCPSFLISADGGRPERICDNCQARGFSADGSWVLMQHYAERARDSKVLDQITAVDLPTKKERTFLRDPNHSVYHAFLSPDDQWVVFKRLVSWTKAQLVIAAVKNRHAAPVPDWIEVTDGGFSDDKPQFSPDGNTVYFTSDRDGYLCIWTQRLDPRTKHPVGSPTAYEHFHNNLGRNAVAFAERQGKADLTVAADKILINLPQRRDDLWRIQVF